MPFLTLQLPEQADRRRPEVWETLDWSAVVLGKPTSESLGQMLHVIEYVFARNVPREFS